MIKSRLSMNRLLFYVASLACITGGLGSMGWLPWWGSRLTRSPGLDASPVIWELRHGLDTELGRSEAGVVADVSQSEHDANDVAQEVAQEKERGAGASMRTQGAKEVDERSDLGDDSKSQSARRVRYNLFQRSKDPIGRAKRPVFQEAETRRLYFDRFYAEATQGDLPDLLQLKSQLAIQSGLASSGEGTSGNAGAQPFDRLVSPEVIEDQVKRNVNLLATQITTPGRFRSDYSTVHQTYVQLAALFAVNEHYSGEVRWQESAAEYRAVLARTAAGTRVGTEQAYQLAIRTRDDLQQITRGERPSIDVPVEPLEDWSQLLYRSSLMIWLEQLLQEQMRPMTNDADSAKANQEDVMQDAELVAMISQLLLMPQMENHDEESYAKHLEAMKQSAEDIKAAYTRQDYDDVSQVVNQISQACDACHEDYR